MDTKPKKDTTPTTILVITIGLLALNLIFKWEWAIYSSLVVGLIGIFSPLLSRYIESAWMGLTKILSYIIPSVLMAIIFYLILFPISLVSKIFTKDPLMLSGKYSTYFIDVKKKIDKKSFENIW